MNTDLLTIKNTLNQKKAYLQSTYNVKEIGIFGSVARGENTKASDIDLLISFSKPVGMFTFIEVEAYLSKLLDKKVDLVTQKALKPTIKDAILKQVIYV